LKPAVRAERAAYMATPLALAEQIMVFMAM
jgi:hypothetical protein